ncbi:MAG: hypothetical protein FWE05_03885 [Defluviitaleaceae bacterium]|nr:hypothetical protein [Defluviitaleaceae bacterium]
MKDFFKAEWTKLKTMTFAEKRWYIWNYYKLQIGGFLIAVFFIGSVINHVFINPPKDEFLYIAWLDIPALSSTLIEMGESLSIIVDDDQREWVLFTDYSATDNPQLNQARQTRFHAMVMSGSIDVFITTAEYAQGWANANFIQPLHEMLAQVDSPALEEAIDERLLTMTFTPEETYPPITDIMAVSLAGSPFMAYFGIHTDDIVMVLVGNANRFDRIILALEVFLNGA